MLCDGGAVTMRLSVVTAEQCPESKKYFILSNTSGIVTREIDHPCGCTCVILYVDIHA